MLQADKGEGVKAIKEGLVTVNEESLISDRIKQILDFNFTELVLLVCIKKHVQNGSNPVFKASDLWKAAEKTLQASGLGKNDLLFALKALENLELVTPVDKRTGTSKMDRS